MYFSNRIREQSVYLAHLPGGGTHWKYKVIRSDESLPLGILKGTTVL